MFDTPITALFNVSVTLTAAGVTVWPEVHTYTILYTIINYRVLSHAIASSLLRAVMCSNIEVCAQVVH